MTTLLALSYLMVAFGFALRTYAEGLISKEGGPVWRTIGLLLCVVWPAVILCVAIEVVRLKRRFSASQRIRSRAMLR
jgi:hypothetical protein